MSRLLIVLPLLFSMSGTAFADQDSELRNGQKFFGLEDARKTWQQTFIPLNPPAKFFPIGRRPAPSSGALVHPAAPAPKPVETPVAQAQPQSSGKKPGTPMTADEANQILSIFQATH